jgi:hypothetical protein
MEPQAGDAPPDDRTPLRPSMRQRKFPTTLAAIVVVILLAIAALFYFSSAQVEITPNTVSASVQSTFTADQSTGTLPFRVVTAQKVATQSVAGSGSKTVNTAASGPITVYNAQAKAQRLVATTRFATAAGLIFRTHAAITVPAGTASKSGSVSVTVYADQNGASYNVGPTSFTVPGLAGTPLAGEVYARSTVPMTGGASGTIPTVDSATEHTAVSALTAALGPDLMKSLEAQVPAGYILVPGAATTSYQELTPAPSSSTGMVDVKEQGTVTAVVFPSTALAGAIAGSVSGLNYQGEPITLPNPSGLTLSAVGGLPDAAATTFAFSLSGTAELTYTVDTSRISAAVAGKTRSEAEVALTNYPEVKRAVLVLRPFWRSSFPADPASITVTVASSTP